MVLTIIDRPITHQLCIYFCQRIFAWVAIDVCRRKKPKHPANVVRNGYLSRSPLGNFQQKSSTSECAHRSDSILCLGCGTDDEQKR